MMKSLAYLAALGALMALPLSAANAALRDPLIDGAKQCTQQFAAQERAKGLPSRVLAAIGNTESGRWNKALGMVLPWPWTVNAEGKGFYFDSKAEAIRKVRRLQAQGMKSIDVGCMQVNLKHHPKAFSSLDQAFDPRHNVAYAATFLRRNYDDLGNWNRAIAAYHSRTPKYGNKYFARVQKALDVITGKVRTARAAMGSLARRDSPSYRIIQVGDGVAKRKSARSFRSPNSQSIALAMRDADDASGESAITRSALKREGARSGQPRKGIALRPQDRLSGVPNVALVKPSYKRISVSAASAPRNSTTLVKPMTVAAPTVPTVEAAVPRSSALKPSSGAKPKFIFVD